MTEAVRTETVKEATARLIRPLLEKGFEPLAAHRYTNERGDTLYFRLRLKHHKTGEKWIRPLHRNGEGWDLTEPKFAEGKKPLYRLHELAAQPGAPVWWCEGENCSDALAKLGVLATTAGSAQSDERADFRPLAGRTVTIWPDNDVPGLEHGKRVAAALRVLGCTVEIVDVARLGLPEHGDVVDWLAAHPGATAADLAKLPRLVVAPDKIARVDEGLSGLVLRRVSEVEARPVRWLWPGRIARGKVSMLAGHPGLGKSQVSVSLAAIVTTGGLWPVDRTRCERGSALILSAEDDPEDTIRPRLEAAGADLTRVHVLEAVEEQRADGGIARRSFSLAGDLSRLGVVLAQLGDVALLVIDPITAYLGETDSHKAADVRAVLAPLGELAAKHGAAVIAVSHLRKSGAGEAMLQVTGSLAFVAAARAAYIVAKDQDDPARRLMLPVKNNLGDDQTGYSFRIEPACLASGISTSRVAWEAERVTVTADEALAPAQVTEERDAVTEAADFLRALLADGPMPAKRIYAEGRDAGYAERTLRRAQKALGVEAMKEGLKGGWTWRLPPKAAKPPEDGQAKTLATFGDVGHLRESVGHAEQALPAPDADREAAEERAAIVAEGFGMDRQAEEF